MLEEMLLACNGANAQYIVYVNSKPIKSPSPSSSPHSEKATIKPSDNLKSNKPLLSTELNVKKRFEFNWNFYKGKLTNETKLHLAM